MNNLVKNYKRIYIMGKKVFASLHANPAKRTPTYKMTLNLNPVLNPLPNMPEPRAR